MSSKRILTIVAAATLGAAVTGIALGSPPFGGIGTPPVRGTIDGSFKFKGDVIRLKTRASIDVVTQNLTLQPGGHSGWHGHEGPVLVVVKSGSVTSYDFDDPTCAPHLFTTGQAFVDTGDGHIARNEGSVPAEVTFTFLLPRGGGLRTELTDPGTCPFSG